MYVMRAATHGSHAQAVYTVHVKRILSGVAYRTERRSNAAARVISSNKERLVQVVGQARVVVKH